MPSRYQGTEEEVRALSAYINLMRAAGSFTARVHRHLAEAGVTPAQFAVLEALLHCGPQVQKQLCHKLLTSSANLTFVVDALEKRGWVKRERGATEDRRCVRVELTTEGHALVKELFPKHARIISAEMSALDAGQQEDLRAICKRLGRARETVQGSEASDK